MRLQSSLGQMVVAGVSARVGTSFSATAAAWPAKPQLGYNRRLSTWCALAKLPKGQTEAINRSMPAHGTVLHGIRERRKL